MHKTYKLTFAGEQLELRADRSLWWPAQKIVFIADLHAGKAEHFQRAGLRVPYGSLTSDLQRLQQAISELQAERVIVLGDLFHSDINNEWQTVTDWIARQNCSIELVRGNHDRFISDQTFAAGGIIVHPEGLQVGPFTLRHHPLEAANHAAVLCGHLHPVHNVVGTGHDRLRLACFTVKAQQLMLPAFGSFTGGYEVRKSDYEHIVCAAPDFHSLLIVN